MSSLRRLPAFKWQRMSLLSAILLCMPLLDELVSGFLFIGLPLASKQLQLDYTQIGLVFAAGALSSMVLDPLINLLSDGRAKRPWILAGLFAMIAGLALASMTRSFVLLLCSFVIIYPAITTALDLSQAVLIDQNLQGSTRTMTRWTIMANIGDLLAPIIVSLVIILPDGWAALCWLACGFWLIAAVLIAVQRFPRQEHTDDDAEEPTVQLLDGLRAALRDPLLLRWAALAILPMMLDEIFVVYATLYMRDVLHMHPDLIGLLLTVHMIGAFLGLFVLEHALLQRSTPQRLLIGQALIIIAGMACFLMLHAIWFTGLALFIIGVGATGLYPIALGQAYKCYPGRSGLVRTVISLGTPFEVVLPSIVGFVAGQFGVIASICILGTAPFLVILLAFKGTSR
jgi:fucose permease